MFFEAKTESLLTFRYFLQGEHLQVRRSGDLEAVHGTRLMSPEHDYRLLENVALKQEVPGSFITLREPDRRRVLRGELT